MTTETEPADIPVEDLVAERFAIAGEIEAIQARHEAELKPLIEMRTYIENQVLDYLNRHPNAKNISTPAGRAERDTKTWVRMVAWPEFIQYVVESKNYSLLKKEAAKLAALEVETATGSLPPGLEFGAEQVVSFTRATKRSKKTT